MSELRGPPSNADAVHAGSVASRRLKGHCLRRGVHTECMVEVCAIGR